VWLIINLCRTASSVRFRICYLNCLEILSVVSVACSVFTEITNPMLAGWNLSYISVVGYVTIATVMWLQYGDHNWISTAGINTSQQIFIEMSWQLKMCSQQWTLWDTAVCNVPPSSRLTALQPLLFSFPFK